MPKNPPPPPSLIQAVDETLISFSPVPPPVLLDAQDLLRKLRLYKYQLRALAAPFQKIAERHKIGTANPAVTADKTAKLKTVKDARTFVSKESGYEYRGEVVP